VSAPDNAPVQRVAVIMNAAVVAASQSIHQALDLATDHGDTDTADKLIDLLRAVSAIDERAREQGRSMPREEVVKASGT
jgi:predicted proteasome-type protease